MRRTIVTAVAAALAVAGCSGPAIHNAQNGPTSAPSPSATEAAPVMDTVAACKAVDAVYTTLDDETREQITKGMRAEMRGDRATVAKVLLGLRPIFASTSAAFTDTAGKVADPEVKAALQSLAAAAAHEATFDSFDDFQSLAVSLAPAEATLKEKCAAAGYALKNVE